MLEDKDGGRWCTPACLPACLPAAPRTAGMGYTVAEPGWREREERLVGDDR